MPFDRRKPQTLALSMTSGIASPRRQHRPLMPMAAAAATDTPLAILRSQQVAPAAAKGPRVRPAQTTPGIKLMPVVAAAALAAASVVLAGPP